MRNRRTMKITVAVVIAVLAAVVMTLLSAVPPLSYLYAWAESNNVKFVWYGLIAGFAAMCSLLYYSHLEK